MITAILQTTMTLQDESRLAKRAATGDKEAFEELWEDITPRLFGYLINTLRDKALAEDILQTSWLKGMDRLKEIRSRGGSPSGWLFAIARNECRMHWRKNGREVPLEPEEHDRAVTSSLDPKIMAESALALLSEDDREILRLRYIAELDLKDISKILDINPIAVRVRIHRALVRARNAFGK